MRLVACSNAINMALSYSSSKVRFQSHVLENWKLKGLIALCIVSLAFSRFLTNVLTLSQAFTRVFDTNMLVSETQVKMREKCEKNARKIKNKNNARTFFKITLCVG